MLAHTVEVYLKLSPYIREIPQQTIRLSYDAEADVLYVSFGDPLPATESELTDEDIIIRYREGRVIGYTILHASRRGFLQGE
ncbi:DUF2283 domain-containing protein [Thermoflexus hugenholtzii]